MGAFSSFAISFSIICILAGCLTSFHLGFSSVGGAAIGIGWPVCSLLSLACALAMAQIASAYPTAGALYHWSSILGGRGWGWLTAWLNIVGLVTVLAAINVGTYVFAMGSIGPKLGIDIGAYDETTRAIMQLVGVGLITGTQAAFNHLGIRITMFLTDLSGFLILAVALVLTIALVHYAPSFEPSRLWTFKNYSGDAGGGVWPRSESVPFVFLLGFLLPAYTITGFDAPAHTSEETVGASRAVPRGIISSVVVSGVAGLVLLSAIVLAIPSMDDTAASGDKAFYSVFEAVLPNTLGTVLYAGIIAAQYLCGLATVTSSSRVVFAFARDDGLPWSSRLKRVGTFATPHYAIWTVATLVVAFTIYTPVYSTITAVSVIFLYVSYVIPTALGLMTYRRTWMSMGPFDLGRWYRVVAGVSVVGCILLIGIAIQPPNDKALWISLVALLVTAVFWFGLERRRFKGPPKAHIGTIR
ncbi:MAG: amino acid permease [Polyangiaceae bacterium]|nr:amino acid permease [Polyangiaceae bacterium]